MNRWGRTMKLEEAKEYWQHNIQVELKDGRVVKGEFVGFERACDEPTGRDCITLYTEEKINICVFLNEVIKIYESYIIDDRPDNHPDVVERREKLLNNLSDEKKKEINNVFQKLAQEN